MCACVGVVVYVFVCAFQCMHLLCATENTVPNVEQLSPRHEDLLGKNPIGNGNSGTTSVFTDAEIKSKC